MRRIISDLRKRFILISPLFIIGFGFLVSQITSGLSGPWAWVPLAVIFWGMMVVFILAAGRKTSILRWLSRPRRSLGWSLLAVAVSILPLLVLVFKPRLGEVIGWLPGVMFVMINPWFEEGFWRGLLLDAASIWPTWLGALYSGVMFSISYPLVWGNFIPASKSPGLIITSFLAGFLWALIYQRTGSLRWVLVGHILFNALSFAAPFL
jgi:membrane protease YdiL (CAAX protease family)